MDLGLRTSLLLQHVVAARTSGTIYPLNYDHQNIYIYIYMDCDHSNVNRNFTLLDLVVMIDAQFNAQ
jgi:hypothetical protein